MKFGKTRLGIRTGEAGRAELHRAAMQAWVDAEVRELSIELAVEMVLAQQTIEAMPDQCSASEAEKVLRRVMDKRAGELSHGRS